MRIFKIIAMALALSSQVFGGQSEEIKKAALLYQRALDVKDKAKLKQAITKDYYARLAKNNLIDRLFKGKKKNSEEEYKVEIIESKVVKGSSMASIRSEKDSDKSGHESKIWVKLEKVEGKFLVSDEVHAD